MKRLLWNIVFICCLTQASAQVPFECNGRSYRVLAADDGTYLQGIIQNQVDETISFNNLHFFPGIEINAIAYHPTQNVIYGIVQTYPYNLCRIDAAFNLEILQELPLTNDLIFVSGDISPDLKNLVIFGFGDTNTDNIVALIDVQDGAFETEILSLQTSNPSQPFIYCADIAFHPTTGKLFGFDFKNGRLVTLDIFNRKIDNNTYPLSGIVIGNVPSIFFNDKGELFGVGTNLQEETENRGYYHFDLASGQPELLQELEIEKNQDACSCPYRIKLLNEVRQRKNAPCTELVFELTLINRSLTDQFDLSLIDTFPIGLRIEEIGSFSFDGNIKQGVGSNVLEITDLDLPIGDHTFEIVLSIDETMAFGDFENQAFLSGIRLEDSELDLVLSDDPLTPVASDATKFSINPLASAGGQQFFGICSGGEVRINTGIDGANSYLWSTGETTEEVVVDAEGIYEVTVTTECEEAVAAIPVTLDDIILELGVDRSLEEGESLILKPTYSSSSPVVSFNWETNNFQSLNCPTCKNLDIKPLSDTEVKLSIENVTGCRTSDALNLRVLGVKVYAPNIFSPVSQGVNTTFFLQGNVSFDIAKMEIYDRWGNLVFQNKNIEANQPEDGWDGTFNGQDCMSGVYIWTANLRFKNGAQELISGDITLLR